jgi:hypothetical protein
VAIVVSRDAGTVLTGMEPRIKRKDLEDENPGNPANLVNPVQLFNMITG